MKLLILIMPAYNEAPVIEKVIKNVKKTIKSFPVKTKIVVVNDGSSDNTASLAKKQKVTVLTHKINRGLGASLGTGLAYAKSIKSDYAITFDSDGQHDPRNILSVLTPLLTRRINNQAFNWLTFLLFGTSTTDSLSGFRGFSQKAIQKLKLKTERMEVSNEFFNEIKRNNLKFAEVPIKVIYTDYSIQKGVKPGNIFAIIFRLILRLFR